MGVPRQDVTRIKPILTGHWPVGEQVAKLRHSCQIIGEKETIAHFLCECLALSHLSEIAAKKVRHLRNYLNSITTDRLQISPQLSLQSTSFHFRVRRVVVSKGHNIANWSRPAT